MEAELGRTLRLNVPEWYQRPDFLAWLNEPGRATWHKRGEPATEYSDVFFTFDHEEGSDFDLLMPEDIWTAICKQAEIHGFSYGVVWISNVGL